MPLNDFITFVFRTFAVLDLRFIVITTFSNKCNVFKHQNYSKGFENSDSIDMIVNKRCIQMSLSIETKHY